MSTECTKDDPDQPCYCESCQAAKFARFPDEILVEGEILTEVRHRYPMEHLERKETETDE